MPALVDDDDRILEIWLRILEYEGAGVFIERLFVIEPFAPELSRVFVEHDAEVEERVRSNSIEKCHALAVGIVAEVKFKIIRQVQFAAE